METMIVGYWMGTLLPGETLCEPYGVESNLPPHEHRHPVHHPYEPIRPLYPAAAQAVDGSQFPAAANWPLE